MENEEMEMIGRHSLAHVMAKAIMKLYQKTKGTQKQCDYNNQDL